MPRGDKPITPPDGVLARPQCFWMLRSLVYESSTVHHTPQGPIRIFPIHAADSPKDPYTGASAKRAMGNGRSESMGMPKDEGSSGVASGFAYEHSDLCRRIACH
jgi:hypothetical protein